jgi:hypothetical protein
MAIVVDGDTVQTTTPGSLGQDEKDILDALHGRGELGERLKKDLAANKNKAKYKIELQFMRARSAQPHVSNLFNLQVWESGRRLHGGGDQRMVFCGYWPPQGFHGEEECGKPFSDSHFGINHVVCPHCGRENFLDEMTKDVHIIDARTRGEDVKGLQKMPIVNPLLVGKLTPKQLAVLLVKTFRNCDGNADLYIKFHPTDIRCRDVPEVKKPDLYDKARADRNEVAENRGKVSYPLDRIIRDTVGGASLEKCFLGVIT